MNPNHKALLALGYYDPEVRKYEVREELSYTRTEEQVEHILETRRTYSGVWGNPEPKHRVRRTPEEIEQDEMKKNIMEG